MRKAITLIVKALQNRDIKIKYVVFSSWLDDYDSFKNLKDVDEYFENQVAKVDRDSYRIFEVKEIER